MVRKAYRRMVLLHKLFEFQLTVEDMVEIYTMYIMSILESSAVVGHSSIPKGEEIEIERIQKVALIIILNKNYDNYEDALSLTGLVTLNERRDGLCRKFAESSEKSENNKHMCSINPSSVKTQNHERYFVQHMNANAVTRASARSPVLSFISHTSRVT